LRSKFGSLAKVNGSQTLLKVYSLSLFRLGSLYFIIIKKEEREGRRRRRRWAGGENRQLPFGFGEVREIQESAVLALTQFWITFCFKCHFGSAFGYHHPQERFGREEGHSLCEHGVIGKFC
jgi:hypothetical protein